MVCMARHVRPGTQRSTAAAAGGGQRGGEGDAELLRQHTDNFTRLLQQLVFSGLDKRPSSKLAPQLAHLAPLWVPAGTDKLRDIGRPRGGGGDVADIATGAKVGCLLPGLPGAWGVVPGLPGAWGG